MSTDVVQPAIIGILIVIALAFIFLLAIIFHFIQLRPTEPLVDQERLHESKPLPYRVRDNFLSPAEHNFYHVLQTAIGDKATVLTKVNLWDIFYVEQPHINLRYKSRIDRKHLDFLLCEPKTMTPVLGIELDDQSHQRPDRRDRDRFVDQVFENANLPLVHIKVQHTYNTNELLQKLEKHLDQIQPRINIPPNLI